MLIITFLILNNIFSSFTFDRKFSSSYSDFNILETTHFKVWYPQSGIKDKTAMKTYAINLAKVSEGAYSLLSKDLHNNIFLKINIVIFNNSDISNGESWPIPQSNIYVYTAPPNISSPIKEYKNWQWELMTHELTHAISFSTTRGYSTFLRAIMGTIITINGVWPLNLTEGLAVYEETHFSEMGRGRSDLYNSLMLGMIDTKDSNLKLGVAPYYTEIWPWGNIPYLYGYTVFAEFALKDNFLPGKFSKYSAGRLPQFIDSSFKNIDNRYIQEIWHDALKHIRQWKKDLKGAIAKTPINKIKTIIKTKNKEITLVSISPNKKYLAYLDTNTEKRSSIKILDIKTFKLLKTLRANYTNFINWNKNEILYNTLNYTAWGNYYILKSFNIKSNNTKNLKLKHINFACRIDKNNLAISKRILDKQILYTFNTQTKEQKEIYNSHKINGAIQLLRCNSNKLFFVSKTDTMNLLSYDLKTKKLKTILKPKYQIHDLKIINDNVYILTRANLLPNILKISKKGVITKLSNVPKGINSFDINNNDAFIGFYDKKGISLGTIDLQIVKNFKLNPKNYNPFKFEKKKQRQKEDIKISDSSVFWSSIKSMIPKFWAPTISVDSSNNINLGVYTVSTDPTFRNQYDLGFNKSVNNPYMQFYTSYTNYLFYTNISLGYDYDRFTSKYSRHNTYLNITMPFVINTDIFNTDYMYFNLFTGGNFKTENTSSAGTKKLFGNAGISISSLSSSMGAFTGVEQGFSAYFSYNFAKNNSHYFRELFNIYLPLSSHTVFNIGYSGFQSNSSNNNIAVGGTNFSTIIETKFNDISLLGYPTGYKITQNANALYANLNIPLFNILFGPENLFPLFMKKMYLKIIYKNTLLTDNNLESYGSELHFKNNIFYLVPIDIMAGFYYAKQLNSYSFMLGLNIENLL